MVHHIYTGVTGHKFQKYLVFLSLNVDFLLANTADPDQMLHYATFYLGLHCLPMYPLTGYRSLKAEAAAWECEDCCTFYEFS